MFKTFSSLCQLNFCLFRPRQLVLICILSKTVLIKVRMQLATLSTQIHIIMSVDALTQTENSLTFFVVDNLTENMNNCNNTTIPLQAQLSGTTVNSTASPRDVDVLILYTSIQISLIRVGKFVFIFVHMKFLKYQLQYFAIFQIALCV